MARRLTPQVNVERGHRPFESHRRCWGRGLYCRAIYLICVWWADYRPPLVWLPRGQCWMIVIRTKVRLGATILRGAGGHWISSSITVDVARTRFWRPSINACKVGHDKNTDKKQNARPVLHSYPPAAMAVLRGRNRLLSESEKSSPVSLIRCGCPTSS